MGRLDEALAATIHACELRANSFAAWALRGQVLADLGRLGDALGALDRSLELRPANPEATSARKDVTHALEMAADSV
jgi:cytochrome c-type biogenesis protein CcmH/NrfG